MAHVGSPTFEPQPCSPSLPEHPKSHQVVEEGDPYFSQQPAPLDWFPEDGGDEILEGGGPSSVEVQPDLSGSPRSISLSQSSCQLDDDFNDPISPCDRQTLKSEGAEDLDTMGVANTWNDEDTYAPDAVPAKGVELTCLGLGQSASSGPWPSPGPLELFDDDRESVCELLGDVTDSNSCPGVCGLRNLGNTCFMNAGLQCLVNTLPLLDFFSSEDVRQQLGGAASTHLASQFASVLAKMWSGDFSTLRPTEFKHTLSLYHSQFKDYRQHDCQEFLALLLDSLHEQLSTMALKSTSLSVALPANRNSLVNSADAVDSHSMMSSSDLGADCCLGLSLGLGLEMGPGEPMELYESSRSSQLSSPRSSDSVETSSSCTTSCSSSTAATRVKAAALSLRSLPIPEEVKQPMSPLVSAPAPVTDSSVLTSDLFDRPATTLVMERNLLNTTEEVGSTGPVLEKNLLSEISCIMKDSKTANVNISTSSADSSSTANNEIFFDSGKFPPCSNAETAGKPLRPSTASVQLVRNSRGLLQPSSSAAAKNKIKMTNVLKEAAKRLGQSEDPTNGPLVVSPEEVVSQPSPNNENSTRKKARIESVSDESVKDHGGDHGESGSSVWSSLSALESAVKDSEEPPSFYPSQLRVQTSGFKGSVVTEAFQGQFRSTVVCCTCKHVSVTYEPFMYLSVPLPRALERCVEVVFVPAGREKPSRHQLVLQQYDPVSKLRQLLVKTLQLDLGRDGDAGQLILIEVVNHHVARILEDQLLLRHLKDGPYWTVFALHVPPPRPELTPEAPVDPATPAPSTDGSAASSQSPAPVQPTPWKTCSICLEEMADSDLRKHTSCPCLLCQSCIEASCRHRSGNQSTDDTSRLVCPVCSVLVNPVDEFAPLDRLHHYRPVIRLLNVSVLFRIPSESGGQPWQLISYPRILQLPSLVSPAGLYKAVDDLFPQSVEFDLVLVDSQGMKCPRCVYPVRCHGCRIESNGEPISLQPGDCLGVQPSVTAATEPDWPSVFDSMRVSAESDPLSGSVRLKKESLTLDDCLRAFSESETLDEGNPWFCPKCQKSQCASKTLNICQAPPFLIIYLKRFVYHDNTSSKLDNRVEFPLTGLNLQPYLDASDGLSSSDAQTNLTDVSYDLYGVVCHFGSASSGHYTAYTRHVQTGQWHYYNDETVLTRSPQEEDFRHGYVLFYQRNSSRFRQPSAQSLLDAK